MSTSHAYAVLLRGINVGGKNKMPMAQLKSCLEDLGCENVQTYIASGNVVCSSAKSAADLAAEIEAELPKTFVLDSALIRILILTLASSAGHATKRRKASGLSLALPCDVVFLMGISSDEAIKIFDPREGVDQVWQGDLAIYSQRLSALRTKSRLSKIMSSPLYAQLTIRNWATTVSLFQRLEALER